MKTTTYEAHTKSFFTIEPCCTITPRVFFHHSFSMCVLSHYNLAGHRVVVTSPYSCMFFASHASWTQNFAISISVVILRVLFSCTTFLLPWRFSYSVVLMTSLLSFLRVSLNLLRFLIWQQSVYWSLRLQSVDARWWIVWLCPGNISRSANFMCWSFENPMF